MRYRLHMSCDGYRCRNAYNQRTEKPSQPMHHKGRSTRPNRHVFSLPAILRQESATRLPAPRQIGRGPVALRRYLSAALP